MNTNLLDTLTDETQHYCFTKCLSNNYSLLGNSIYSWYFQMTKCSFDPTADIYKNAPIGMFHCPECGEMVVAGLPHPDWDEFYDEDEE